MWKDYLKKAMISLVTLAIMLGIAEFAIRQTCTFCNYMESNGLTYLSPFNPAPFNGRNHIWNPNQQQDYSRPEFSDSLNIFTTNSFGLRDIEHPIAKDSNEFRIICLGDSFTEGVGVSVNETYVKQLENKLKARGWKNIRIINGGMSGADPYFSYTLLKDKLLVFDPDLVLLAFNDSDIDDIIVRGGMERFLPDGTLQFAPRPKGEWWFSYSHLVRGVMLSFFDYDWYGLRPEERVIREKKSAEDLEKVFIEFKKLSKEQDFTFATFHHPADEWSILQNEHKYKGFKEIADFIQENQIAYFDITEYMHRTYSIEEDITDSWFWNIDMHCNQKGYEVFANGLLSFFENTLLLESEAIKDETTFK